MKSVAHIITDYLPYSQTFIYSEITHMTRFRPVVLYLTLENKEYFPFRDLIYLKEGAWKLDFPHKFLKPESNSIFYKIQRGTQFLRGYFFYKQMVKSLNIKLLHAQFGSEAIIGLLIKEKFNLPLITSFRGWDAYILPKKTPPEWKNYFKQLFDIGEIFLARSKIMRDDIIKLGCPKEKIIVHHSGLDLTKFPFKERKSVKKNEQVKILFVGRFVEKKNPIGTLEVFSQVKEKYDDVCLTMIGDGPLLEDARKRVDELGLSTSVKLIGYQPQARVVEEMLGSHIFFMPFKTASDGDREGIPNSVKEASATGLPVVSTSHSGVPEAVLNGKTGLLAGEGDSVVYQAY